MWDGSFIISRLLETRYRDMIKGKSVVELGAGASGLPSQVAAVLGARNVICTDISEEIPHLIENIDRNRHLFNKNTTIIARELHWESIEKCSSLGNIDVILCADLVFGNESLIKLLVDMILYLLAQYPLAFIIMSNVDRLQVRKFRKHERIRDLCFETIDIDESLIKSFDLSPKQIIWIIRNK